MMKTRAANGILHGIGMRWSRRYVRPMKLLLFLQSALRKALGLCVICTALISSLTSCSCRGTIMGEVLSQKAKLGVYRKGGKRISQNYSANVFVHIMWYYMKLYDVWFMLWFPHQRPLLFELILSICFSISRWKIVLGFSHWCFQLQMLWTCTVWQPQNVRSLLGVQFNCIRKVVSQCPFLCISTALCFLSLICLSDLL